MDLPASLCRGLAMARTISAVAAPMNITDGRVAAPNHAPAAANSLISPPPRPCFPVSFSNVNAIRNKNKKPAAKPRREAVSGVEYTK